MARRYANLAAPAGDKQEKQTGRERISRRARENPARCLIAFRDGYHCMAIYEDRPSHPIRTFGSTDTTSGAKTNAPGRKESSLPVNETIYDLEELRRNPVSRRAFFTRMSMAGLGVAAASLLAGCGSSSSDPLSGNGPIPGASPTPVAPFSDPNFPGIGGRNRTEAVLNFALTLEILEADLYRQFLNAASGRALTAPLDTTAPSANSIGNYTQTIGSGGLNAQLSQVGFLYLVQYAYVEAAHRDFLATTLGSLGAPVAQRNARGYQLPAGSTADLKAILSALYPVEETGVRAYEGAAALLPFATAQDKSILQTAAAIHSTEAKHSVGVGYILGADPGPVYSIPGVTVGYRPTDKQAQSAAGSLTVPNIAVPGSTTTIAENTFQYYSIPTDVLAAVKPFFL